MQPADDVRARAGVDGGLKGSAVLPASGQLATFAADFEANILRPVREKRAAGDEILAIQPVALGVVRDPEWEGVVDGEVGGLGPIADSVRTFLHWVPIKLETREALRLCVSCGDALAREGEFACARKFYDFVSETCEGIIQRGRADPPTSTHGTASRKVVTSLARDEACWMVRATFGAASMELRLSLTRDPHVQFSATLTRVVTRLRAIQSGMHALLSLPKEEHDAVSWLVLEGSVLLFDWCEPLSVLGHGGCVAEFLAWSTLATESMVSLSTVKHLPWRTRLAVATCYAFEDAGNPSAAANCAAHALEKLRELRRQEGMDPPVPLSVHHALDVAEGDLRLLSFKYTALAAALSKRPPTIEASGGGGGGDSAAANGTDGMGEEMEGGLSEEDLNELLDEHIPDESQRPAALLELMGRAAQGSSSSTDGGGEGTLTAREASVICRCTMSLLRVPDEERIDVRGDGGSGSEGATASGVKQGEPSGGQEEGGDSGGGCVVFPLDIEQEMQLMREMNRLGEFQAWEVMLPATKQRLRKASTTYLPLEDSRAFWFEIALWASCTRLKTWRDKPEPKPPATKGGLKRTPPAENGQNGTVAKTDNMTDGGDDDTNAGDPRASCPSAAGEAGARGGHPTGGKASGAVVVAAAEAEEELREALLATRPSEVVEIPLEGDGTAGARVNLTPMLTVAGLLRKALFGPYRHLLEKRGEAVLDATMSLWEPYVEKILKALDTMPGEAEVDSVLLDAVLLLLETISACLSALNGDDESLRATVALRLAIVQADFRGDRRKACQTLRGALAGIDKFRQNVVSHHLHHATAAGDARSSRRDTAGNFKDTNLALSRASISTCFRGHPDADVGADEGGAGVSNMSFHEVAALQLDVLSTLFRVELLMGRDTASQLAKHQKAEAAAQLSARRNASKRKRPSNKASKVTFGDSEGRSDTLAGSLAAGWSVTLPADIKAGGGFRGGGGGGGDGIAKALTGTNAIVCAAGGGPLPTKAAAAIESARQNGVALMPPGSTAAGGREAVKSKGFDGQKESCPVTEARLTSEFRRNPYGRALLLATMARFRTNRREQEQLLAEAAALLRHAKASEITLLRMIPSELKAGESSEALVGPGAAEGPNGSTNGVGRRASTGASLPAPFLLSRSHKSIELLPFLSPRCRASKLQFGSGGSKLGGKSLTASNGTSTSVTMEVSQHGEYSVRPRIAKVCVYGKAEGAGTGVTLGNTHFAGLGVPTPFDEETGVCGAVSVRGLSANESYVFSVAAFDEHGDPIGEGVGDACQPVETLNPLPLPLCWAHLSRTALGLGCSSLAAESAQEVYRELMMSAGAATRTQAPQELTRKAGTVDRSGRDGGDASKNVGTSAGPLTTTNLREGWMASPLLGQAFDPEPLDRCPRGVLQGFVQACFVLVDTADEDAMAKAESGEGAPLEGQVCRLVSLKRLSLACEVSVLLQDWDLVTRGVWRAYHLLLPLLRISAMGRLLFQIMCQLHQCLALVPKGDGWDAATKTTFACLAYQITIKGNEIGESRAARATLLDNGPERDAEVVVFKDPSHSQGDVGEENVLDADTPAQIALLEVWMGLPGYGTSVEHGSEAVAPTEAADFTCSKLRKALDINDARPVGETSQTAESDDNVAAQSAEVAPLSTSEAIELLMSATHKNPSKGWELLQEASFMSHPDRARLLCRVCWIALSKGMAQQVVSWLGSTPAGEGVGDNTAKGEEGGGGPFYLLAESDLEPLSAKVLALEGTLTDLPYILPTPERRESAAPSETPAATGGGKHGARAGGPNGEANDEGAAGVDGTGDDWANGGRVGGADAASCSDRSSGSRDGGGEEGCLDALSLSASAADIEQLLRLAEVEHILGAACLQLGFAAAPAAWEKPSGNAGETTANGMPSTPAGATGHVRAPSFEPSRPTEAEVSEAAAGGRRPRGYGTGPFAQVSATKADVFVEGCRGGDGEVDGVDADEEEIISRLEDNGTPWPTADQVTSAVKAAALDSSDTGTNRGGEEGSGKATNRDAFALFLSKAMLHLTRAASRARWGQSWAKTERACGLLWNTILSLWLSPQDFCPEGDTGSAARRGVPLGIQHGRIYAKACEALLDAVDAAHGSGSNGSRRYHGSTDGSNPENAGDDRSTHRDGIDAKHGDSERTSAGLSLPLDKRWVSRFVEWGLQGILRCRCWGVVVKVASRLLESTGGLHGGNRVYLLALCAQKQLCSLASALLSKREAFLQAKDDKFEAAQAKRRRRKVLKALETKSKEELEHERAREPLLQAVGDARVRKQIHDHRLGTILQSRDTYAKTKKIGRRTLDDARESLAEHLALLSPPPQPPLPSPAALTEAPPDSGDITAADQGEEGNFVESGRGDGGRFRETADPDLIAASTKAVLKLYGRAVDVLRDKRERELLAEALCDMGDLHALGGCYSSAAKCWTDAIDSLCSALDSSKHWRQIFASLRAAHPSPGGPPGGGGSLALALGGWTCLAGGTVLGKLSMYTGQSDMRGQLNLCLMAAEMFRGPLETSLPFPQRECDYAAFTPDTLGGPGLEGVGLWTDDRRWSASALSLSLMHVQGVLTAAGCSKEAFPVQAIVEHVASKVTLSPLQLVRVKLARMDCLAKAGFPAEAASALAAVLSGEGTPKTTGGYAGRREAPVMESADKSPAVEAPSGGKGKDKKGAKGKGGGKAAAAAAKIEDSTPSSGDKKSEGDGDPRQMAKSGLPFYGFVAYQNNLPLGHADNAAAISWLIGDPAGTGEAAEGAAGLGTNGVDGNEHHASRHVRLLKRGLSGVNPALEELRGGNEACMVALARARLLLTLADCSAMVSSEGAEEGQGGGNAAVLRRVRDAADCILGEILQVIFKRISPAAIRAPTPPPDTGRSGKSAGTHASSSSASGDNMVAEAAEAAYMAATAPGETDGWAPPMAAEALLMRGRLALLDGKLRVCRHHASRGMAVVLRHGLSGKTQDASFPPLASHGALVRRFTSGGAPLSGNGALGDAADSGGTSRKGLAGVGGVGDREGGGTPGLTFADEQTQPWKVVQTWLELRHDLAVVALLQGRTKDAIFQTEKGMEEASDVGEAVISNRLRRLRAQAAVAEGQLERAVADCRDLAADYLGNSSASALDLAAVLRLLAKIRRQQSLVCGEGEQCQTLSLLSESLEALRVADKALLTDAKRLGWIGSGVLTYSREDDHLMGKDAKPSLLHALGTCFRDLSNLSPGEVPSGFAPSDEKDEVAQSPLANLYLPALRLLLIVRVSLLDVLEGVGQHNNKREGLEQQVAEQRSTDNVESCINGQGGKKDDAEAAAGGIGGGSWLDEASILAEETLALFRHVAHPHPALRAHVLLLVGRLRLRRLQSTTPALTPPSSAVPSAGGSSANEPRHGTAPLMPATVPTGILSLQLRSRLESAAATALTSALRASFSSGGHDSRVMIDACMCLVRLYTTLYNPSGCSSSATSSGEGSGTGPGGGGKDACEGDGREAEGKGPSAASFDEGERERKLGLACHFLRLAAAISSGRKRLESELDSISSEPLPPAVVENMPRSALDELAGRGGRGPEDDPLRLTTRGVLQLLRASGREKSLAAAPADLLPATVVCQIHSLLYRHVPVYRDKCCVQETSLQPPSSVEGAAGQGERSAGAAVDLTPGTVCVQWVWDDHCVCPSQVPATSSGGRSNSDRGGSSALGVHTTNGCIDEQQAAGLYPARTAFILLPPALPSANGKEQQESVRDSGEEVSRPSIALVGMLAVKADSLRRRASQLKALLTAFKKKAPADPANAALESGEAPPALEERFRALLLDVAQALSAGSMSHSSAAGAAETETTATETAPGGIDELDAEEAAAGSGDGQAEALDLSVENVEALEGVLHTGVGVDVENEQLCLFLRAAIGKAKTVPTVAA